MKFKYILSIIALLFLTMCTPFDVTEIEERLDNIEERLEATEAVLDAYENNLFITEVNEVENGYTISFTDGSSVTVLKGRGGQNGEVLIESISVEEMEVLFYLSDGTSFSIPLYESLAISFDDDDLVVMDINSEKNIHYIVESRLDDIKVEVIASSDIKAKVIPSDTYTGVINIKTGDNIDEYSKVIVLVSNGKKITMKSISFEQMQLYVSESCELTVEAAGGNIPLYYMSNMDCDASVSPDAQDWISILQTKSVTTRSIPIFVEANSGVSRKGSVTIGNPEGLHITYSIVQDADPQVQKTIERKALTAIYESLRMDEWGDAYNNWCTDLPVSEWQGITVDENGFVREILLQGEKDLNEASPVPRALSPEIGKLSHLQRLDIGYFSLEGDLPVEMFECSELTYIWLGLIDANTNIPKEIGNLKKLEYFSIMYYNGEHHWGTLPPEIGNCKSLKNIQIERGLSGSIPEELGNCHELFWINFRENELSGTIPASLGNCDKLCGVFLDGNNLYGSIPGSFGNLKNLRYLTLFNNNLSGNIPKGLQENELLWDLCWGYILWGNGFNPDSYSVNGDSFILNDINGNQIVSDQVYADNEYTLLLQIDDFFYLSGLNDFFDIYEEYHKDGFEIISYCTVIDDILGGDYNHLSNLKNIFSSNPAPFPVIPLTETNDFIYRDPEWSFSPYYPYHSYPALTLVDRTGKVVFYDFNAHALVPGLAARNLRKFLAGQFADIPEYYASTDYSMDGSVEVLQKAVTGNGIDIVLMGDAYSDRLIADGTYKSVMQKTVDEFFSEEPYKTYRDYFNVYMVNVVSKNEVYDEYSTTALDTWFGEGTEVGGSDAKVFEYALKAIPSERLDEALVIVMMNKDYYAGTCYMYHPSSGDYGNGTAVAYFPSNSDDSVFKGLLLHEAGGHGFAKLDDEYAYEYNGSVPEQYINERKALWPNGWWKNIDFTSDVTTVKWAHFLSDERYKYDGLGTFEGASTYWTGVWRPTENSIMRYNTDGYNAPSREAIYTRIHKLAFGEVWEYDYEDFVSYDAINRKSVESASSMWKYVPLRPTVPPVIVKKTWQEVMNN